jgi:hypothetical protein
MGKKKPPKRRVAAKKSRPEGPYLSAAVLCEHVLLEKDGINSIVRMYDKLTVSTMPVEGSPRGAKEALDKAFAKGAIFQLPLTLFVGFKSGNFKGQKVLSFQIIDPNGNPIKAHGPELSVPDLNLVFRGDEAGANAHVNIRFSVKKSGLYWIDLFLDEGWVTSVPLRVNIEYGAGGEQPVEKTKSSDT